jgi:gamma-glutamyltranspeptidase/glutathione hydrolase
LVVGVTARLLVERGTLDDLSPVGQLSLVESLDRSFSMAHDEVYDRAPETVPDTDLLVATARDRALLGPVPYGPGTVFTTVADDESMVALVSSICDRFGCGVTVAGCGFVLGSRARGFRVDPAHPNVVGPAKRPYHTIVPTVSTAPCGENTWRIENESSATAAGVAPAATIRPVA